MKTKSLMIAIALMALVMGITSAADAGTVTISSVVSPFSNASVILNSTNSTLHGKVAPNGTFWVLVKLSDATGVAGAALTLTYDNTVFDVVDASGNVISNQTEVNRILDVDSDTFKIMADNRTGATVAQDYIRVAKVDSANGKVMFSGASIDPATGASSATGAKLIFRVHFKPKSGLTTGTGQFSLSETTGLTTGGWQATDHVPALIGAVAKTDSNFKCDSTSCLAFPSIPYVFDTPVSVTIAQPGAAGSSDIFGDGKVNMDVVKTIFGAFTGSVSLTPEQKAAAIHDGASSLGMSHVKRAFLKFMGFI